ncbi:hypothetical protein PanWU01x14_200480 [Parasponia andersonii]|uniref:Uncharacterized protein n=1 Tax=Parasponia andersonii TaxID=3476 RepID=A0A2P5BY60_PARAD|nr:hypothetical protein PanWU01x14_200480 [Parasponia andersonii]
MRVEDQMISFNVFKETNSPSDLDDYYRVDLVKESIEENTFKKSPLISHEVVIIDEEVKKALGRTSVGEALQYFAKSNPPIKIMEMPLSSSNHYKPYKKDTRKWRTKKKKHGDHQFEPRPRGVLGPSCLKLFMGKLKARWSKLFKETNVSPCDTTSRIKVNIQKLKEYLGGELDRANSPIASPIPL